MTDKNDLLIIDKVLQGDTAMFALLVEQYRNMAFTLAYNIILNREDAEELVQDSFVKAFTGLKSFNRDSKFSTWFYRIIVNTCLNKKRLKKLTLTGIDVYNEDETIIAAGDPIGDYNKEEQRKYVRMAMDSLNENERLCITLFYLNELSIEEINDLTGISSSNIKVLLFRGRKKIYARLQALLGNEIKTII